MKSVRRTKLSTAFPEPGKEMMLLFDYGVEWRFKVKLTGLGQREPGASYPRVVERVGTAPPQYPDFDDEEE